MRAVQLQAAAACDKEIILENTLGFGRSGEHPLFFGNGCSGGRPVFIGGKKEGGMHLQRAGGEQSGQ